MNLSMKWLADFVDVSDVNIKDYCDKMTLTGSKVEGYEVKPWKSCSCIQVNLYATHKIMLTWENRNQIL